MREKSLVTPEPPYDVIIFTGKLKTQSDDFHRASLELYELMQKQDGFLGAELVRAQNDFISVHYYWKDLNLISIWEEINRFMNTKEGNQMKWFEHYKMRIGRIEREFEVDNNLNEHD